MQLIDYVNQLFSADLHPNAFGKLMNQSKAFAKDLQKEKMSISEFEGRLLQFFVRLKSCQRFIEVGTFTGYSALWILSGIAENGKFWTLEKDPIHSMKSQVILNEAKKSLPNVEINIIEGDAVESLKSLSALGPFDGVFIDGNKSAYGDYLDWVLKNIKSGGLVIADNVFLRGSVWEKGDGTFNQKQTQVLKEFNKKLSDKNLFDSIFIPTSEGLSISIKK